MDFRNNTNTPREMVSDDMLLRILAENEQTSANYGGNGRNTQNNQRRRESSCGCGNRGANQGRMARENRQVETSRGCGCKNHTPQNEVYETRESRNSGDNRRGCSCGSNTASEQNISFGTEGCSSCGNREKCGGMAGFPIAMAYVPWQIWRNLIECDDEALKTGTIFNDLNLPWNQSACNQSGCNRCGENK